MDSIAQPLPLINLPLPSADGGQAFGMSGDAFATAFHMPDQPAGASDRSFPLRGAGRFLWAEAPGHATEDTPFPTDDILAGVAGLDDLIDPDSSAQTVAIALPEPAVPSALASLDDAQAVPGPVPMLSATLPGAQVADSPGHPPPNAAPSGEVVPAISLGPKPRTDPAAAQYSAPLRDRNPMLDPPVGRKVAPSGDATAFNGAAPSGPGREIPQPDPQAQVSPLRSVPDIRIAPATLTPATDPNAPDRRAPHGSPDPTRPTRKATLPRLEQAVLPVDTAAEASASDLNAAAGTSFATLSAPAEIAAAGMRAPQGDPVAHPPMKHAQAQRMDPMQSPPTTAKPILPLPPDPSHQPPLQTHLQRSEQPEPPTRQDGRVLPVLSAPSGQAQENTGPDHLPIGTRTQAGFIQPADTPELRVPATAPRAATDLAATAPIANLALADVQNTGPSMTNRPVPTGKIEPIGPWSHALLQQPQPSVASGAAPNPPPETPQIATTPDPVGIATLPDAPPLRTMSANTPAPTAVSGQSDPAFILDTTLDTPLPATTGADNRAADPSTATPSPRPEPVTTQIAHRILSMPAITERDAPLELTLDPPELGQIRISVTRGAEGMILHLHADQPETLDLLRRHGGALMQELQRQGLDHAGYSFSGRDQGSQQQKPGAAPVITAEDSAQTHPTRTPHPAQSAAGASGQSGLDIRL